MKWLEEIGMSTSVHSWKPCTPERFARLFHAYTTTCCDDYGNAGMSVKSAKLDHESTVTVYHRPKHYPLHSGTSTPALMTVRGADGRVITFERIPSRDYPGLQEVLDQA